MFACCPPPFDITGITIYVYKMYRTTTNQRYKQTGMFRTAMSARAAAYLFGINNKRSIEQEELKKLLTILSMTE